jgi:hypothetical protein
MNRQLIYLLIPILVICGFVLSSWIKFMNSQYMPQWQHYVALTGTILIIVLLFTNRRICFIATGLFLLLGIFRCLSLTTVVVTNMVGVGNLVSPGFNALCLGLFVLYVVLNVDAMADLYQDIRQPKSQPGK